MYKFFFAVVFISLLLATPSYSIYPYSIPLSIGQWILYRQIGNNMGATINGMTRILNQAVKFFYVSKNHLVAFDKFDRILIATIELTLSNLGKGTAVGDTARKAIHSIGMDGDQAGHIIGKQLGGSGTDLWNLFPQSPEINNGPFKAAENLVYSMVNSGIGTRAQYTVMLDYENNDPLFPKRPAAIMTYVTVM